MQLPLYVVTQGYEGLTINAMGQRSVVNTTRNRGEAAMFTVGAFAIILDSQQRVLLCHRRDMDRWNLPGGGVMSGETPWQAVIREVQEEE